MLTRIINKAVRVSKQQVRRVSARTSPEIDRLRSSRDPRRAAIGQALFDTVHGVQSSDEASVIRGIEARRAQLLASKREVPKLDFGAGSGSAPRIGADSGGGVRSMASVATICKASKPEFWAKMLFHLARKLKPNTCFELGTCVGISAAYQGCAMQMNDFGRLTTFEGSPDTADIARETLAGLGVSNTEVITGPFQETLQPALEKAGPIDYFFNDGHHDRDAVLAYFEQAQPYLTPDAVVMFDDVSWSAGMREAWTKIEKDRRVALSIDLHDMGIVVLGERPAGGDTLRIPL